ncbi:MAG TPA: SDR family NAD(P)-dependent oxidoreductase [Myxococcota bacterium]|nr:SDR family NAD(P)-dependent oxidoreductase [Myxococcota bacterium]
MGLLDGKRALVTGAASGIGRAVARRFADEGAALALLDRDAEGLEAVARETGGHARVVDVGDAAAARAAVEAAAAKLGGLDVVSNNAGIGRLLAMEHVSAELFDELVRVNLSGTFHVMQAALPFLRASGAGSIVNNASESGVRPTRGELPYSAAKAGVIAATLGAAQECAPEVRVNCVSPGVVRTAMTELLFQAPGLLEPVNRATPLGRTGTAEEVADVILFLASDLSRYVTGQNLVVDGGMGLPQAGIDDVLRTILPHMKPDPPKAGSDGGDPSDDG